MYNKCTLLYLAMLMALISAGGCAPQNPTFTDMIGTWMAEDSCTITLNVDSTCEINNINMGKIDDRYSTRISFKGKWEFDEYYLSSKDYNITIHSDIRYRFILFISGSRGLFRTSPPWRLYYIIGDPDEWNLYEFIKKE